MKRTISILCLLFLLLSMAASCGEAAPAVTGDTTTAAPVETNALTGSGLEIKDWGGKTFNVLTSAHENTSFCNFEVIAEEENGEILNDAIYNRNVMLEELLNVEITQTPFEVEFTAPYIREAVMAGDSLYNLAFARSNEVGALALDGMLYDMNLLEYVDTTGEWWDDLIVESAALNGNLYFASSDFNLHAKKRTYMIIYNTDLAAEYQIGNLADVVREGKWTIDKMTELVKLVSSDLNGDSKMTLEDRYGLVLGDNKDMQYYFVAAGGMIAKKNESGGIDLTLNNEKTIQLIDKYLELASPDYTVNPYRFNWDYTASYNVFWSGRALFYDGMLGEVESASKKAEFGYKVLPLPKLDETQDKYYTMPDNIGMLFCVPANVDDPDFTGYMLEALSYVSSTTTLPTYYEKCCKIKSVYDEDSAEMIDLAMSSQICDIGFVYNIGGLASILNNTLPRGTQNNFTSLYAASEQQAEQAILDIYEKMESLK